MSSRALRKAQREREEQEQLRKLQAKEQEEQSEEEDEEEAPAPQAKASMFAMLNEAKEDDEAEEQAPSVTDDTDEETSESAQLPPQGKIKPAKIAKKKKKRKKAKAGPSSASNEQPKPSVTASEMDEIDLALRSLSAATSKAQAHSNAAPEGAQDAATQELCRLLSVDTQHLHAANEMRRLFGRAAVEADQDEEPAAAGGRRRGRGAQPVGIAGAVAGRNTPGRGLASLGLRRNIFIQGKEEWPRATGGGLGMEIVEKRSDGIVQYKFVHNRTYQDVQRQFDSCVASMDPNRLVQLLQFNPYHISTLLQVSEIAKQERDHATSGDLLERALFSFGRAVHSTFANNLSQGKARLDFRRPENREFWLAAWRYIGNLSMRATWRTVYEWAKLLLSLDPEGDPYCVGLVIDQYSVRGRHQKDFLDLFRSPRFQERWNELPNIRMTASLALIQTAEPKRGREELEAAIRHHPWVAARLLQELSIDTIPPSVWGKMPRTPYEKLLTELYVTRAKDIWNTPEATSLLMEVASSLGPSTAEPAPSEAPITLDLARHTILTDSPALISLLPKSMTSRLTSVSDPLAPDDNKPSYSTSTLSRASASRSSADPHNPEDPHAMIREYRTLQSFFQGILPWFRQEQPVADPQTGALPTQEDIERRIEESGVPLETIVERTERMDRLHRAFESLLDGGVEGVVLEDVGEETFGGEEGVGEGEDSLRARVADAEGE